MRRTFKVSQSGAKRLRETVKQLFTFRDWAVHPPAGFRPAIRHDFLDEGVEWRFVAFRASNAVTAAWAATSIIDQCLNAPRAPQSTLEGVGAEPIAPLAPAVARLDRIVRATDGETADAVHLWLARETLGLGERGA